MRKSAENNPDQAQPATASAPLSAGVRTDGPRVDEAGDARLIERHAG